MLNRRKISRTVLGIFFIGAGINHFVHPQFYLSIMPPALPAHELLVELSGLAEILLGGAVYAPRLRAAARWGLIALLIAVFPANIHMAFHSDLYPGFNQLLLWCRLPIQAVLIYWVYSATRS